MTKIIAMAGGTASGKTTILKKLKKALGNQAEILTMDAYYKPYKEYSFEERVRLNYDHPNSFDIDLYVDHVKQLIRGKEIQVPVYDFVHYTRRDETVTLSPKPIILLEGLFVLYYQELKPLIDLKVYIQADADIRLIRRIRRDQKERGRSLESILNQYMHTIKPMHEAFIAPTKKEADLIIPRGAENERGVGILIEHVQGLISTSKIKSR